MSKEKAVNYTEAQVAMLKAGYTGADNKAEVAALAVATGKTANSVRAKLASMDMYVAEAKASKTKGETKRAIAEKIAEVAGLKEFEVDGLEKATKSALDKVLVALTNEVEVEVAE